MTAPPPYDPSSHPSMPQQLRRPDWDARDYWVRQPTSRIPPPPFQGWVPPAENIAFGELPRDSSRYQALQAQFLKPPIPPLPPPIMGVNMPQQNARPDWTLRDYSTYQDRFSILATPLPPPPNNMLPPQHNARPDWTLRDYSAFQDQFSAFHANIILFSPWVPPAESIGFGELPRDMTTLRLAAQVSRTFPGVASARPPPGLLISTYAATPYDLTAQRYIVEARLLGTAFAGIPTVPLGGSFAGFENEPIDMTPYIQAMAVRMMPAAIQPQIPPSLVPYIEPPGWQVGQYEAYQDRFSALGTPAIGVFPKGLRPQFALEALIRESPRPQLFPVTFRTPPPPPRVFPSPPTFIEWRQWGFNEYPSIQDMFSALAQNAPIAGGFRVMAVTAGQYGGYFYQPGDVFDIVAAADFSDSSINYQAAGGDYVLGWMVKVPSTTPLSQAAVLQQFFVIPDPNRRFIM
jgi:hypothetical protein